MPTTLCPHCSTLQKNMHHSFNFVWLSYICQGNPLNFGPKIFVIFNFLIFKKMKRKHFLQAWKVIQGTLDHFSFLKNLHRGNMYSENVNLQWDYWDNMYIAFQTYLYMLMFYVTLKVNTSLWLRKTLDTWWGTRLLDLWYRIF